MATPPNDALASEKTTTEKPIHSLILDTGPLIKNDPSVSDLIAKAEVLYTLPSIVPEIRDKDTRIRVETTLMPFVTVRAPKPASVKFIREFARKTGDLGVLSRPDLEVLALGYELELERNGGDWRLRNTPGQKSVNGKSPAKMAEEKDKAEAAGTIEAVNTEATEATTDATETKEAEPTVESAEPTEQPEPSAEPTESTPATEQTEPVAEPEQPTTEMISNDIQDLSVQDSQSPAQAAESDASDDEGGWITPSNLKKQKAKDAGTSTPSQAPQRTLQAAVLTSDYAMQNVALRMNLNLITPSFSRITQLKTWILRCHGCFKTTRDMDKQFCPNCGQPTLTRVSCSTDEQGNFKLHLKKNFQWNNRGNVYSVPKPTHGTSNGRLAKNVAGKGNWGNGLMLAEDQKEYVKAGEEQRRAKKKDLMDDDYLPNILSGDRAGPGRIRVGAGKTVNSRKR